MGEATSASLASSARPAPGRDRRPDNSGDPSSVPGRGSALPYRCSRTPGRPKASSHRGSPSCHRSPSRFTIATGLQQPRLGQRQAAERAELLLELVGRARVQGVVAAVVRPRRDLVDVDRAAVGHEQLDAEHADVVQRVGRRAAPVSSRLAASWPARLGPGPPSSPGSRPGAGSRRPETPPHRRRPPVPALPTTRVSSASRSSSTHATPPRRGERRVGVRRPLDRRLALAVVSQPAGLEQGGQADLARRRRAAPPASRTGAERRGGEAARSQEASSR